MTPERWQQARALFDAAVERSPSEADAILRAECDGDAELHSEVRRMLYEQGRGGALDGPVWEATASSPVPSAVFSPGQIVAGRYRIVRYLSCGGMGEVYEAEHPLLPDRVALKTLLPAIAADDAMIARFKQEIQLARKIAHPNVCKVFDLEWHEWEAAPTGKILFLTMEFLDGETLSSFISRQGRIGPAEALPLLEQMADALAAAHRCGVIHRDFKASNVMVAPPRGGGLRAVVTDFGLARAVPTGSEATETLTRHVAGTLDYMAPELLTGSAASFRSDIYALGMVAYKMVTGELPFAGEMPMAAAFLRAKKPIPSPRIRVPGLDATWERAILRALEADPDRRFQDASEFPKAIRGEAVSASLALPAPGRRRLVAAVCALAVLAAGTVGWRTWWRSRGQPGPEAMRFYQQGVDDIHAGAYFAATKALEQAVPLAPAFSPARARLAESWLELDLPEKAALEFVPVGRQDNSSLPKLDRLEIEAVDLTITREFPAAVAKYEEMRRVAGDGAADLDIDLGRAYEKAAKPDEAIKAYRLAAEGPWHSAAAWLRLGVLYDKRKMAAESNTAFAEAERRYQQISNLEGLTELTLQRGIAANRANRYPEAAVLLRKAIERAHDAGNLQQEISAKLTLANVSYAAGDTELTQTLAREALDSAQANQMESLTIRGFLNLANGYLGKGDFGGAEKQLQEALALALRTNSARLAALTELNLASLHDRIHSSEKQIREATSALGYFQPNHVRRETFQALLLIGRGEQYRGNYADAIKSFQPLLDQATAARDKDNIAIAEESLGDVFFAFENYPVALEHYRGFQASSGNVRSAGYAARDCGMALAFLGRYQEAAAELTRAEGFIASVPLLRPSISMCRAEMALSRNQFRNAIEEAQASLVSTANLNPITAPDLIRIVGLALIRSTDQKAGLKKCREAYAAAQKLQDRRDLMEASLALLEALLAVGDFSQASGLFREIEPSLATKPESKCRALALMARSQRQYRNRAKEALAQLETLWGEAAFAQYLTRNDVSELLRPVLKTNSANN